MKIPSLFFLIIVAQTCLGQIYINRASDLDNLNKTVVFEEDFNDEELNFSVDLKGTTRLLIDDGICNFDYQLENHAVVFSSNTNGAINPFAPFEINIRFKFSEKLAADSINYNKFSIYMNVGHSEQYTPIVMKFRRQEDLHCYQRKGQNKKYIKIREPIGHSLVLDEWNDLRFVSSNKEVIIILNDEILGRGMYNDFHGDELMVKFVNPYGQVDHIRVFELSKSNRNRNSEFNFASSFSQKNSSSNGSLSNPIGQFYALIIGNNDYLDPDISSLDQPIRDASNLATVLTNKYIFDANNVLLLKNASRSSIIEAFDVLSNNLKPEDNLIIFYAGHGYWDEVKETGYWLPVDASVGSTVNWLRNSTIQEFIDDIPSKHTLLIADACFGGGIFKTRKAFDDAPQSIENLYKMSSRKGITSGMLNEVPDRSVFMEYLIQRLNDNSKKYLSSLELFTSFRVAVMNNSSNTPQYGTIHNTGDEGGDFVFILK